jgi:hypothetical protein
MSKIRSFSLYLLKQKQSFDATNALRQDHVLDTPWRRQDYQKVPSYLF